LSKYAEHTQVSITSTVTEIDRLLDRYGADGFMYGTKNTEAQIMFAKNNRIVRFMVEMPDKKDKRFWQTETGRDRKPDAAFKEYDQEKRRRWRALLLVIKAKLEAVDTGITSFEQEFLAHFVMPDDKTLAEHIIPRLDEVYATGQVRKMIPFFGEGQ
jgi:hypothetical protein